MKTKFLVLQLAVLVASSAGMAQDKPTETTKSQAIGQSGGGLLGARQRRRAEERAKAQLQVMPVPAPAAPAVVPAAPAPVAAPSADKNHAEVAAPAEGKAEGREVAPVEKKPTLAIRKGEDQAAKKFLEIVEKLDIGNVAIDAEGNLLLDRREFCDLTRYAIHFGDRTVMTKESYSTGEQQAVVMKKLRSALDFAVHAHDGVAKSELQTLSKVYPPSTSVLKQEQRDALLKAMMSHPELGKVTIDKKDPARGTLDRSGTTENRIYSFNLYTGRFSGRRADSSLTAVSDAEKKAIAEVRKHLQDAVSAIRENRIEDANKIFDGITKLYSKKPVAKK